MPAVVEELVDVIAERHLVRVLFVADGRLRREPAPLRDLHQLVAAMLAEEVERPASRTGPAGRGALEQHGDAGAHEPSPELLRRQVLRAYDGNPGARTGELKL